jgi:transposase, IS5 family
MREPGADSAQFKRANRKLKKLRTHLGRVIRDIARLERATAGSEQRQRGPKTYSLHAPEGRDV